MKTVKATISRPIQIGAIQVGSEIDYYAAHYLALIQCLLYQKNLELSPKRDSMALNWSLANLRGNQPLNFFAKIRSNVQNHGLQYFLTTFLNFNMNEKVIEELLSELETVTQLEVEYDYASYKFYMAGKDSTLSQNTELRFNEVYGHCDSLDDVQTVLNRSDICLVLSYENRTPIAFFGEVEGNHGDAQARASYWKYRPRLSVFSIGRSQGGGKNAFIYTSNHDGIPRVHLKLEQGHYVVEQFDHAIYQLSQLLLDGPSRYFTTNIPAQDHVLNVIRNSWNKPALELEQQLLQMTKPSELMLAPQLDIVVPNTAKNIITNFLS